MYVCVHKRSDYWPMKAIRHPVTSQWSSWGGSVSCVNKSGFQNESFKWTNLWTSLVSFVHLSPICFLKAAVEHGLWRSTSLVVSIEYAYYWTRLRLNRSGTDSVQTGTCGSTTGKRGGATLWRERTHSDLSWKLSWQLSIWTNLFEWNQKIWITGNIFSRRKKGS